MEISQSNVGLFSAHQFTSTTKRAESLKIWFGTPPEKANPAVEKDGTGATLAVPAPPRSTTARVCNHAATAGATQQSPEFGEDEMETDPHVVLIRSILERLFGLKWQPMPTLRCNRGNAQPVEEKVAPTTTSTPTPPTEEASGREGWGVEYDYEETRQETEQLAFSAKGTIQTRDGQEIQFELNLAMKREYVESRQVQFRAGDAVIPVDPLVINFDGQAADLTERTYQFDLNADGQDERIASVKAGSAFLVLDRNQDGKVNNGKELFGPVTGNGFTELASYDADQNGWIDSGDPVHEQLRLWNPAVTGDRLTSLEEKGVAAIYLKNLATPFTYKAADNQTVAELTATSVVLSSENAPGTIQQVNLVG